jgi:superfamily II DNA/RNA helicase
MAESRPSSSCPTPGFAELGVPAPIVSTLAGLGINQPFPIQSATLPDSLAGRDVLGRGRTGSGKTYAFVIPLLARLAADAARPQPKRPRALILAPTRELAGQIQASVAPLAKELGMRTLAIFGGVGAGPQISALRAGIDVLIACPGRLEDLMSSGHANLDQVRITVLDEADHMADLGFLPAVRRLLDRTPSDGQRMLFSATLDAGVDVLVRRYLSNPVTHSVDSAESPVASMAHHALQVDAADRLPVLVELTSAPGRTLVFSRTKHGAKKLTKQLIASGVPAVELHGNLSQNARTRNLQAFADGEVHTLVATDIAARGIHVDDVALVVHADPPMEHKAYLHRSGRTARAGASGTSITLMTADQVNDVRALTKRAAIKPIVTRLTPGHPLLAQLAPGQRVLLDPASITVGSTEASDAGGSRGGRSQGSGRARGARTGAGRPQGAGRTASSAGGSGRGGSGHGSSRGGTGQGSGRGGSGQASGRGGSTSGRRGNQDGHGSRSGSTPVHSTSSSGSRRGGAAAFSASVRSR